MVSLDAQLPVLNHTENNPNSNIRVFHEACFPDRYGCFIKFSEYGYRYTTNLYPSARKKREYAIHNLISCMHAQSIRKSNYPHPKFKTSVCAHAQHPGIRVQSLHEIQGSVCNCAQNRVTQKQLARKGWHSNSHFFSCD